VPCILNLAAGLFLISLKKLSLAVVFQAPKSGLVPAQTKKKEKIGTIFCPKGGLAVATIIDTVL
jgi:hypothetical protein